MSDYVMATPAPGMKAMSRLEADLLLTNKSLVRALEMIEVLSDLEIIRNIVKTALSIQKGVIG